MANVTIYQSFNFESPLGSRNYLTTLQGYSSTSATYKHTAYDFSYETGFTDVSRYESYYGQLAISSSGNVTGRVTGYELRSPSGPIVNATVDADAALVYSYIQSGARTGLLAYALSGNDTITGSNGSDTVTGFSGNDLIDLKTGSDYVYFYGPAANYTFEFPAAGKVLIVDKTGSEGTDTLIGVEYMKFSDTDYRLLPLQILPSQSLYGNGLQNDVVFGSERQDNFGYAERKSQKQISVSGKTISVRDLASTELDVLTDFERIYFSDGAVAFDTTGVAGQAYRIYKAAFNRTPDAGGLGYWIGQMDAGMGVVEVAARFIDSPEFRSLYGQNPTNAQFLTKVYSNVLARTPDEAGLSWWVNEMKTNPTKSWQKVLADFSESPENQANVASLIANGIEYSP